LRGTGDIRTGFKKLDALDSRQESALNGTGGVLKGGNVVRRLGREKKFRTGGQDKAEGKRGKEKTNRGSKREKVEIKKRKDGM